MPFDLHHHLVFGVDDGPKNLDESLAMLLYASKNGITDIVCTSHDMPGERPLNKDLYFSHLQQLREAALQSNIPVTLHPGSEILYTPDTIKAIESGTIIPLGESNNLLIEFFPDMPWPLMLSAVKQICETGCGMVLAHAERYDCLRDLNKLRQLKEEHRIHIQLNADTVLSGNALFTGRPIRQLLKSNLADVIASDAHDTRYRPCRLAEACNFLKTHYSDDLAHRLCQDQPKELTSHV